ncbi:transmembrane protein, putative (macronuclear) [Tetrahymena thermophila SB210]|uniref:Transmembrane protein, putative n=1 Tax=Tetrahymena thermophila (strain SB210) TaxID=312017 RepID=W7X1J1_TETTS|nr:transmembrane protein, putative [Tetrahymena thermophila SB210]EWS73115.1 transmembrane protein, putative [Tetrahymena thermophila SB210]|eukprot:XP_012654302.1 transmembrane protein, putative [Tetrahymena thermophila SB210]
MIQIQAIIKFIMAAKNQQEWRESVFNLEFITLLYADIVINKKSIMINHNVNPALFSIFLNVSQIILFYRILFGDQIILLKLVKFINAHQIPKVVSQVVDLVILSVMKVISEHNAQIVILMEFIGENNIQFKEIFSVQNAAQKHKIQLNLFSS